ncbi:MAG: hypothetical protein H7333_11795 [Bdellovibrionales bacterium]|nr:hypothetical protein [Oligoflexia bacterium]
MKLPASPANCVMVDEAIIAAENIYLGACIFANPTKADFLSGACVDGLIDFRSSLTHFLYQQKRLSDIESLAELTDLLYFEYARGRILEDSVHPIDYRRLGAIATQANPFQSPKDLDKLWNDASEALVRFKKIQPNHFSNADTVAAIESRGFQGKLLLPYSISLLEKNPNDSRAFF